MDYCQASHLAFTLSNVSPLLSLVELSQTVFDGLGQINIHLGEDFYSQVNIPCQQNILR